MFLQVGFCDVFTGAQFTCKLLRLAFIHFCKLYVLHRRRRRLAHLLWVTRRHLIMQTHLEAVHVVGLVAAVGHLLALRHQYKIVEVETAVVWRLRLHQAVYWRQCDFWRGRRHDRRHCQVIVVCDVSVGFLMQFNSVIKRNLSQDVCANVGIVGRLQHADPHAGRVRRRIPNFENVTELDVACWRVVDLIVLLKTSFTVSPR